MTAIRDAMFESPDDCNQRAPQTPRLEIKVSFLEAGNDEERMSHRVNAHFPYFSLSALPTNSLFLSYESRMQVVSLDLRFGTIVDCAAFVGARKSHVVDVGF